MTDAQLEHECNTLRKECERLRKAKKELEDWWRENRERLVATAAVKP